MKISPFFLEMVQDNVLILWGIIFTDILIFSMN